MAQRRARRRQIRPRTLSAAVGDGQLGGILRTEWRLWQEMRAARPWLRFGDYGVQNPVPPHPGHAPLMRASIRYTAGDYMLAARGEGPVLKMSREAKEAEYRELAQRVFEHPSFAPCCSGDQFIADCAWLRRCRRPAAVARHQHAAPPRRCRKAGPCRGFAGCGHTGQRARPGCSVSDRGAPRSGASPTVTSLGPAARDQGPTLPRSLSCCGARGSRAPALLEVGCSSTPLRRSSSSGSSRLLTNCWP